MTTKAVGYKAKAFELRNLMLYFLIVFGLMAAADWLEAAGAVKVAGEGLHNLAAGPGIVIIVLASWGPLLAAFGLTALTEGKAGVKALWGRFWNRNMSFRWLLVALLIIPAVALVTNLVIRALDAQAHPLFYSYNPPWTVLTAF